MDPQLTNDGKPYGPYRYKEIIRECYYISKTINTSYNDLLKITPIERQYLLSFIVEDINKEKEMIEKAKKERKNKF